MQYRSAKNHYLSNTSKYVSYFNIIYIYIYIFSSISLFHNIPLESLEILIIYRAFFYEQ